MEIFGTALIGISLIVGKILGNLLGFLLGVHTDVGGVGFAMLILLVLTNYVPAGKKLQIHSENGIRYWKCMYIPIVIAMASTQNVVAALSSGFVAILGGVLAVILGFVFLPLLVKEKPRKEEPDHD